MRIGKGMREEVGKVRGVLSASDFTSEDKFIQT